LVVRIQLISAMFVEVFTSRRTDIPGSLHKQIKTIK
jgi:hypothetical protein